jgi:hypothetical protein
MFFIRIFSLGTDFLKFFLKYLIFFIIMALSFIKYKFYDDFYECILFSCRTWGDLVLPSERAKELLRHGIFKFSYL